MDESSVRAVGWARSLPMSGDVKAARDWSRERLRALGWTDSAPETVDAVLLTVSELVTNAHVHAHSNAQLVMTWDTRCLHVAVHDASTDLPTTRTPSAERLGGRGILLVDALADSWEARPCPYGKTVVACFHPPAATAPDDPRT
ncbi:ATP-binding protein [Streptomyces sp. NRRL WC-3753]|nr:ATP-binding protein [Streptomyces sp. NRRL WC-3753]MZE47759.1 ATP-binding protein [Streptomyces sp. SID5477]OWA01534.1 ATP-binding protein [Streptomyces sp. CS159]